MIHLLQISPEDNASPYIGTYSDTTAAINAQYKWMRWDCITNDLKHTEPTWFEGTARITFTGKDEDGEAFSTEMMLIDTDSVEIL